MLGFVGLLALAAVSSVVVGNMYLSKQAAKLNELKVEDQVLDEQQTALVQAKKDLEKYTDLEKIAKAVVPQDKDQAKAVVELIQIAKASKINIKSVTFPSSNLGAKPATPEKKDESSSETNKSTEKTSPISQAKPVDGIPGVYSLEMTVVSDETASSPYSYNQFIDFLSRLENNRRTAQVTQIKIIPTTNDAESPFLNFVLVVTIYVKP